MYDLFDQPAPGPFSRNGALATSAEAAAAIAPEVNQLQRDVLAMFARDGAMTADECCQRLYPEANRALLMAMVLKIRPRCSEMVKAELLGESTVGRGVSLLGNPAAILFITSEGRRVLASKPAGINRPAGADGEAGDAAKNCVAGRATVGHVHANNEQT